MKKSWRQAHRRRIPRRRGPPVLMTARARGPIGSLRAVPTGLTLLLLAVLGLAVLFDYINGFHDTANAIATSVSTRALRPEHAILMSATANFVGALTGTAVAKTISSGLADDAGRRRRSDDRRGGADRGDHLEPASPGGSASRARRATP